MDDIDAIETFNVKQLATATDRLLLVGPHRRRCANTTPVGGLPLARGGAANVADKTLPRDLSRWLRDRLSRALAAHPGPAQNDDEGSLVVLGSLQLSIATGGVDRSDFERYGQAIGEDLGGRFGMKQTGREAGRDLGGFFWDNRQAAAGALIGGPLGGRTGGGLFGGVFGGLFGFGLGRR